MGLLEGKVALVTGGTSGIGRASAVLFAQEGAKVVLTGRRADQGKAVAAEIEAAGGNASFVQADLADIGGIPAIVDKVVARYGRLDCAFNNAGVADVGPLETLDEPRWDTLIDTNLKAQFFCLKAQAAQMKKQGNGGSIVSWPASLCLAPICTAPARAASSPLRVLRRWNSDRSESV